MGISRDDCIRHAEWRDKHGISVRLLSDTEGEVCKQYGVLQVREVDGVKARRYRSARPSSSINTASSGTCCTASNAKGHAMEVLRTVKDLH